jgi:hypothetical protein
VIQLILAKAIVLIKSLTKQAVSRSHGGYQTDGRTTLVKPDSIHSVMMAEVALTKMAVGCSRDVMMSCTLILNLSQEYTDFLRRSLTWMHLISVKVIRMSHYKYLLSVFLSHKTNTILHRLIRDCDMYKTRAGLKFKILRTISVTRLCGTKPRTWYSARSPLIHIARIHITALRSCLYSFVQ